MVSITNPSLQLSHDHAKGTVRAIVTCNLAFTAYEISQMRQGLRFKAKCRLHGADEALHAFAPKYFPDATPAATEKVVFDATLGAGALDEDAGADEVHAQIEAINLYTLTQASKKTSAVPHGL